MATRAISETESNDFAELGLKLALRSERLRRAHKEREGSGGGQGGEVRSGSLEGVTPIHDFRGNPLFRDFVWSIGDLPNTQIRIRTAATKIWGVPIVSISRRRRSHLPFWMEAAGRLAQRLGYLPVNDAPLVCYSYPKLGIRCTHSQSSRPVVMDLKDGSVHRLPEPWSRAAPRSAETGGSVWSPLDAVEDKNAQANLANHFDDAVTTLASGSESGDFGVDQEPLKLSFVSQQNGTYCAVAVAKMILDFYQYSYSQDQIATVMRTNQVEAGTEPDDQMHGYEFLTHGTMKATLDPQPDFLVARREIIERKRPFKLGTPVHALAISGCRKISGVPQLYALDPGSFGSDDPDTIAETWHTWTELFSGNFGGSNKFDFIRVRRLEDPE